MKCSAKEVLALKITTESYLRGARAFSVFSVFGHVLLETHQRLKSIQSPLSVSQFERQWWCPNQYSLFLLVSCPGITEHSVQEVQFQLCQPLLMEQFLSELAGQWVVQSTGSREGPWLCISADPSPVAFPSYTFVFLYVQIGRDNCVFSHGYDYLQILGK